MSNQLNNVCIMLHCICKDYRQINGPHEELFVSVDDLKRTMDKLLARGYVFTVPWEMQDGKPNCIITFDDGYFNNILFNEISKEYKSPFIIFLNSYNIINRKPFIWDIWDDNFKQPFPYNSRSIKELYNEYAKESLYKRINNDLRRPFTIDELRHFIENKHLNLGFHNHHHQPFIRKFSKEWKGEVECNRQFFLDYDLRYVDELSLPNGLYTFGALKWAKRNFKRIYTIDGGGFKKNNRIINRITLESSLISGDLINQIDESLQASTLSKLRARLWRIRKSYNVL